MEIIEKTPEQCIEYLNSLLINNQNTEQIKYFSSIKKHLKKINNSLKKE